MKCITHGANVWIYTFTYAELPTCIMHSSWFVRNIANNLKKFESLICDASSNNKNNNNSNGNEVNKIIKKLMQTESILLAIFGISFLYVRAWLHTRVLVGYMVSAYSNYCPMFDQTYKVFCYITGVGLNAVNFFWCYKIVAKAKRELWDTKRKNQIHTTKTN